MREARLVTATGVVSAAGLTAASLFDAIDAGRQLVRPGQGEDPPCVPIEGFDPREHIDRKGLANLSRTSQLACVAAVRLAPALDGVAARSVGVVLGCAWGSLKTVVDFERSAHVDGPRFVDPFLFAETVANVPAGQISIVFGWSACNVTVSSGPASGCVALGTAIDLMDEERADVMVAGGADEMNPPLLRTWRAEGKIAAAGPSLPFAADRHGRIGGEGGCLLAIEGADHAAARGAAPLARLRAATSRSRSCPDATAMGRFLRDLMDRAEIEPSACDLILSSAGGDPQRDRVEALGILEAFGEGPGAPPVVAPRGILGEGWGASGAMAAVIACEAIRRGRIPASPGADLRAPDLAGLNLTREGLDAPVRNVVVIDGGGGDLMAGCVIASPEGGDGP